MLLFFAQLAELRFSYVSTLVKKRYRPFYIHTSRQKIIASKEALFKMALGLSQIADSKLE